MDFAVLRAYVDYFLPREILGPVVIVFSLESVVDGIFNLYVPDEYALLGWSVIFLASVVGVAYWGARDADVEELRDELEELRDETDDQ
ncbi:hypothetical protein [Halocalculus aciditolerans]|uniref:Uncharacterized protein n=1 Tax=Halocalculus aciditolerans TaxID=1383812 RepID=A0A830FGA5_9EURY|nr:hypothetical protein [Halocalculus aciditolerans]GGL50193.1 hypothetical protein GCM10009039_05460 [Halocalculus aciditolerans]